MRIESFWAKGFRSLRDVRLENLGPFNVFYGPNGSGKSNILAAMGTWLRLIPVTRNQLLLSRIADLVQVTVDDYSLHSPERLITLGGRLVDLDATGKCAEIELEINPASPSGQSLRVTQVDDPSVFESVRWESALSLISADRWPRAEATGKRPPDGIEPLSWYFRRGHLKDALFAAQNASSPATVRALERFRALMAGPPLHRPPFRTVEDPHTGIRDLREWLPPPLDAHDVSLDLAGLGIAQIYWILGQAMLSGARLIGIEEPEAHLHAPTSGRHLRELLKRLVDEKHIDQLFIATHSNLFDLDPAGYFDVSLKKGETVVERADLTRIDRDHLYEPGPAKHALQRMLEYMPREEIVFRRADRSGITADEMLRLLQEGDDLAVRFLEDLHGAAMRMVKVGAKKKAG